MDEIYHNIRFRAMHLVRVLYNFIRLTRPLFLIGGALLYSFGVVVAIGKGYNFNLLSYIIGQLCVSSIQLMTHYLNEYFDQESDALNQSRTWFSGGSGVLSSGAIRPMVAWKISIILAVLAVLVIGYIGLGIHSPLTAFICLAALGLAWYYSAPPLRLCASGVGELSATLVVTVLVPLVGFSLQSGGKISLVLLAMILPLFFIHFAMLIAFQIPDYAADLAVGKKTLAVRLGLRRVIDVHNLLLSLAYCTAGLLFAFKMQLAGLIFIPLPLAVWQFVAIRKFVSRTIHSYLPLTMRALALFALSATLFVVASLIINV
jgi:1,4-dihydroxy-2-naphthoate polyprenyltransferase